MHTGQKIVRLTFLCIIVASITGRYRIWGGNAILLSQCIVFTFCFCDVIFLTIKYWRWLNARISLIHLILKLMQGSKGNRIRKCTKEEKSFVWHFRVSVFFILLWLKAWKWDVIMCVLSSGEMSGQVMQPAFDSTEFVNWHFFLTFSFWF